MSANTPLVILAPRMTDDSKAIWKTSVDMGWSAQRVHGWRVPEELLSTEREVIIYGEPLFAEAVADQMGLVLLEPPIDWLTKIPEEYLLRNIAIMSLERARMQSTPAFVKPADGKIFDPKVYQSGAELPTDEHVDSDILVLRSGIINFRLEVRCFIREGQLLTLSPYWRNDDLAQAADGSWPFLENEEAPAREFAIRVLSDKRVELAPACTLDIGLTSIAQWAIVESNPCWGAGIYGCDPRDVLSCIRSAVLKRDSLQDTHNQWISQRRRSALP